MTRESDDTHINLPDDLPDELIAVIGAFAVVRQLETRLYEEEFYSQLNKQEQRMILFLEPPRRMGETATFMGALPSSVTAMADTLEAQGLLVRQRDPNDGRAWQLALTPAGKAARAETISKVAENFRAVSGLTPEETKTFGRLATKSLPDPF